MRKDAIAIEEGRLDHINDLSDYKWFKERHRVLPAIFENRRHRSILDLAAGVGCSTKRIRDRYPADLVCSDITPTCLNNLHNLNVPTVAFDIDDDHVAFPFPAGHFDAIVSLVTIEHVIEIDHFMEEINRILKEKGFFYLCTPNYAALEYLAGPLFFGRAFHDPFGETSRYEFYAHVRYFTYKTLIEYVRSFNFVPDTVYLALPGGSSRYKELYAASKPKALAYRYARWLLFNLLSPRWATEPIVCFQKTHTEPDRKIRKVIL